MKRHTRKNNRRVSFRDTNRGPFVNRYGKVMLEKDILDDLLSAEDRNPAILDISSQPYPIDIDKEEE